MANSHNLQGKLEPLTLNRKWKIWQVLGVDDF